jgi:plasmid stabilization system protein ParE
MARKKPSLAIVLSPTARTELKGIYAYNVEHRSLAEANKYEDFLLSRIARLATEYEDGREVPEFPELKSLTLKPSRRGEGHVVIYEIDLVTQSVHVHHLYHTRMDIQGRLESEFR